MALQRCPCGQLYYRCSRYDRCPVCGRRNATEDDMARPTTLTGPWKDLADALGGVSKLADELAVDAWTIGRWARGDFKPHAAIQKSVNQLAKRHKLPAPFGGA